MCIRDRYSPVDLQKPAVNRLDKIAANGGAPDKEITDWQRKQIINILNKYESIFKKQHTITNVYEHKIHEFFINNNIIAVSYTHLDVYKRQGNGDDGLSSRRLSSDLRGNITSYQVPPISVFRILTNNVRKRKICTWWVSHCMTAEMPGHCNITERKIWYWRSNIPVSNCSYLWNVRYRRWSRVKIAGKRVEKKSIITMTQKISINTTKGHTNMICRILTWLPQGWGHSFCMTARLRLGKFVTDLVSMCRKCCLIHCTVQTLSLIHI